MAKSVNKVILLGNVGKDPEMRSTPGGTLVATFSTGRTAPNGTTLLPSIAPPKSFVITSRRDQSSLLRADSRPAVGKTRTPRPSDIRRRSSSTIFPCSLDVRKAQAVVQAATVGDRVLQVLRPALTSAHPRVHPTTTPNKLKSPTTTYPFEDRESGQTPTSTSFHPAFMSVAINESLRLLAN